MKYIMQRYGDRGSNLASLRERCHTIPANPMSDRGQMVIEIYEIQVKKDRSLYKTHMESANQRSGL